MERHETVYEPLTDSSMPDSRLLTSQQLVCPSCVKHLRSYVLGDGGSKI